MTVPLPKRRLLIRGPNIKTKRKPAKCAKKKVYAAVEMVKIAIMNRGSPGNDAFRAKTSSDEKKTGVMTMELALVRKL